MERQVHGVNSKTLLLVLVFGCCACTGNSSSSSEGRHSPVYYNADSCNITSDTGILQLNGQPLTGILYRLGNHRDTMQVVGYKSGKENGLQYSFYDNGQLRNRGLFVNGWKQGKFEAWYPDGKKRYVYNFKNDEYDGQMDEWLPDGTHIRQQHYKNGHEDGLQQLWYEDGSTRANYEVKGDRIYGLIGTMGCSSKKKSEINN